MPYIKQDIRQELDPKIDSLSSSLRGLPNDQLCGELNYCLFRLVKGLTDPKIGGKKNYATYNAIIGSIESCKQEIYRRLVTPYEDEKIKENGDVELDV